MQQSEVKAKSISGVIWQVLQRLANKLVSFIVSLILARLLLPEDFGLVALTSIFLTVASVFIDSGLGISLVRQKEIDHLDVNSVFYFGQSISIILYVVLFICAPLIASLYNNNSLTTLLRLLGLNLLPSSFSSIQASFVSRSLAFRKFFFTSLISTIASAIVGLYMAISGYGPYALVGQSLTQSYVGAIALFVTVRWLPKLEFSLSRLKRLYLFGVNLMAANLIGTFFNEIRGFIIGLKYKPEDLAYYNRGDSIPGFINGTITGSLTGVMLPAISHLQDSTESVRNYLRRTMKSSTFVLSPIFFILIATSDTVITLLYTEKWAFAVPFMQIACLSYLFTILSTANLQAINAIGRSDITLKLEFIKKPVLLAILFYTASISPLSIAIGCALYALYAGIINAIPNQRLLNYRLIDQLLDILPNIAIGAVAGLLAFISGRLHLPKIPLLIIQWVVGASGFILISKTFKLDSLYFVNDIIKKHFRSRT